MEKKRSVGVIIGVILLGLVLLLIGITGSRISYSFFLLISRNPPSSILRTDIIGNAIILPILSIFLIVCGIGLLALKNWARKLSLLILLILLVDVSIMPLLNAISVGCSSDKLGMLLRGIISTFFYYLFLYILIAFFLTRPKVKEQFR